MKDAVAVVILIDDLMMRRSVDLESSDVLERILARERNPCLDVLRHRSDPAELRETDFGMIGEAEIALAVRRRRIARRARNRSEKEREAEQHGQRRDKFDGSKSHHAIVGGAFVVRNDYRRGDDESSSEDRIAVHIRGRRGSRNSAGVAATIDAGAALSITEADNG